MSARLLIRSEIRPAPDDWGDDDPMTLIEAVAVFGERYPVKVSTLRSEIHRGRLAASIVGGSYWITPASLKALFQCPANPKARASTSAKGGTIAGPARASPTDGSSVTERAKSAQVAALRAWGMPSAH